MAGKNECRYLTTSRTRAARRTADDAPLAQLLRQVRHEQG